MMGNLGNGMMHWRLIGPTGTPSRVTGHSISTGTFTSAVRYRSVSPLASGSRLTATNWHN